MSSASIPVADANKKISSSFFIADILLADAWGIFRINNEINESTKENGGIKTWVLEHWLEASVGHLRLVCLEGTVTGTNLTWHKT